MHKRIWAFLIAAALPLLALGIWTIRNQQYPINDPSQVVLVSQRVYLTWQAHGFWEGLKAIYYVRDKLKCVLPPGLLAPLFYFTNGDVLWFGRIVAIFNYTFYLLASFLALEMVLPLAETTIATAVLGLLPWCIANQHYFNLEVPVLAANLLALRWLWRARHLDSERAGLWFGVFLGFALCVRPAEAINFFLFPCLLWVGVNLRAKILSRFDILVWFAALIPFLLIFFMNPGDWNPPPGLVGRELLFRIAFMIVPAIFFWSLRKPLRLNATFAFSALFIILLVSLWYAPMIDRLHFWLFGGSFGEVAQGMESHRAGLHLLYRLGRYLFGYAAIPFLLAGVLGLFSEKISKRERRLLLMTLFCCFIPVVVAMGSFNHMIRYHFTAGWLIFATLTFLAFSPAKRWRMVRVGVISLAGVLLLTWNFAVAFGYTWPVNLIPMDEGDLYIRNTPLQCEDPIRALIERLPKYFPKTRLKLAFAPAGLANIGESGRMEAGYFRVTTIAQELGLDWEIDFYSNPLDQEFYKTHEGVMLGPLPLTSKKPSGAAEAAFTRALTRFGWKVIGRETVSFCPYEADYVILNKVEGWAGPKSLEGVTFLNVPIQPNKN